VNDLILKATLLSIQVGMPHTVGQRDAADPMDQLWTTGFFKHVIAGPVWLGSLNLNGDGQADLQNHGGPEKAVNVYPSEHYSYWEQTLGLTNLPSGAFGENFTTRGILESDVCIGDVFEIGDALVQVSQPRQPCWKLARRWRMKDLALRVQDTGRTGWYFRVMREGLVQPATTLTLIERPFPEWTVATANTVMHHRTEDREAARSLQACRLLSERWRATLSKRVASAVVGNSTARLFGPNE
jgi:MOSC domain-containing protein YiiM